MLPLVYDEETFDSTETQPFRYKKSYRRLAKLKLMGPTLSRLKIRSANTFLCK
jgi:hypothetical protein